MTEELVEFLLEVGWWVFDGPFFHVLTTNNSLNTKFTIGVIVSHIQPPHQICGLLTFPGGYVKEGFVKRNSGIFIKGGLVGIRWSIFPLEKDTLLF